MHPEILNAENDGLPDCRNKDLSNMICVFGTCLNPGGYILFALGEWEGLLIEEVRRGSGSTKKVKHLIFR